MSDQEIADLKLRIQDLKNKLSRARRDLSITKDEIKSFALGKLTNLPFEDEDRWRAAIAVIDEIRRDNSHRPASGWEFFVTSISTNVVFECYSPHKCITREELYRLVAASLPVNFTIGEINGKAVYNFGFLPLRSEIDFAYTHSFTCN